MNVRPILLSLALATAFSGAVQVRADDKKEKVDPKIAAKEKAMKKAKEDIEKAFKGKKLDPQPAISLLEKLVEQAGIDVGPAKDLVNKVASKKVPWDQAAIALDEKIREAVDEKTSKVDAKKVATEFGKWVSAWKPEKPEKKEK